MGWGIHKKGKPEKCKVRTKDGQKGLCILPNMFIELRNPLWENKIGLLLQPTTLTILKHPNKEGLPDVTWRISTNFYLQGALSRKGGWFSPSPLPQPTHLRPKCQMGQSKTSDVLKTQHVTSWPQQLVNCPSSLKQLKKTVSILETKAKLSSSACVQMYCLRLSHNETARARRSYRPLECPGTLPSTGTDKHYTELWAHGPWKSWEFEPAMSHYVTAKQPAL